MASTPQHPGSDEPPGDALSRGVWRIGSGLAQEVDTAEFQALGSAALRQLLLRTLRQAESSQRSYRSLLDAVPDAVTVFDRRGRVVEANAAACVSFGLARDDLLRMTVWDLNPELPPGHMRHVWSKLQLGHTFTDRAFNLRADGTRFPVDIHSNGYLDQGRARIVAIARDITSQLAAEEALTRQNAMLSETEALAGIGGWEFDVGRGTFQLSTQALTLLGQSPGAETNWKRALRALRPGDAMQLKSAFRELAEAGTSFELEVGFAATADARWLRVIGRMLRRDGRRPTALSGTLQDVTQRRHFEEQLHQRATQDPLTLLPNRQAMLQALEEAIARGEPFALLSMDLDRFKIVNDFLGHAGGDRLLVAAAQRMRRCCGNQELLVRFGGDEFLILRRLPEDAILGERLIARLTAKLNRAFARPFRFQGQDFSVTLSIGVARWPDDGHRMHDLLSHADAALYEAKQRGRNQWRRFDAALAASIRSRLVMETELRRALDRHEMSLHYQSKVDLRDGSLVGTEALLRWNNRLLGETGPDVFIPRAEGTGDIVRLGAWALRQACCQWREWHDRGLVVDRMAVNVSPRQLVTDDFPKRVARYLGEFGMPGEALEIEITEHALIEDLPEMASTFVALKSLGVKLVIDDFGEGYAGLNVLRRLPFDGLKIGHQLMQGVPGNDADTSVCEAIVHIARRLRLTVVAEGIETQSQRDFMVGLGAEWAQGFFFGRPVDAATFFRANHH